MYFLMLFNILITIFVLHQQHMHAFCENTGMPILCRFYAVFMPFLCRFYAVFMPFLFRFYSFFIPRLFLFYSAFIPFLFRVYSYKSHFQLKLEFLFDITVIINTFVLFYNI